MVHQLDMQALRSRLWYFHQAGDHILFRLLLGVGSIEGLRALAEVLALLGRVALLATADLVALAANGNSGAATRLAARGRFGAAVALDAGLVGRVGLWASVGGALRGKGAEGGCAFECLVRSMFEDSW